MRELIAAYGAGCLRHGRQVGIIADWQGLKGEPGASADQLHPGVVSADVDRLGRQAAGDISQ
jgi:hypothetical protein